MTRQWIRKVNLTVGKSNEVINVSELRLRFAVSQYDKQTPTNAVITITNLASATAKKISKEYNSLTLQAGYEGNCATIFQGEILQTRIGRENPVDTYCWILAKEGQTAYSYAMVNKALAAGHTFGDQVQACLDALKPYGITAGFIADLGAAKMPRGKPLFGMVRDQLRAICQATNTSWSIQSGKLQIVKNNEAVPGNAVVLNSRTGLVGMPTQTLDGIEFRCLLNPQIRPGTLVQIDQASIQQFALSPSYPLQAQQYLVPNIEADGFYRVIKVDHTGDTRGNDFYTSGICWSAAGKGPAPLGATTRGVDVLPRTN